MKIYYLVKKILKTKKKKRNESISHPLFLSIQKEEKILNSWIYYRINTFRVCLFGSKILVRTREKKIKFFKIKNSRIVWLIKEIAKKNYLFIGLWEFEMENEKKNKEKEGQNYMLGLCLILTKIRINPLRLTLVL